ncbi:hypothetical protein SORBI_3008G180550 [Sorghum bicolor]|uniref:Uncharacterized protein n=1 Tax=Sorghum bicolor TaxID=4558 RepID=A0A1Z5R7C3_SORBI|nr:hypothetical protein SORBI_3008G180550 [Sorghum bicolor]
MAPSEPRHTAGSANSDSTPASGIAVPSVLHGYSSEATHQVTGWRVGRPNHHRQIVPPPIRIRTPDNTQQLNGAQQLLFFTFLRSFFGRPRPRRANHHFAHDLEEGVAQGSPVGIAQNSVIRRGGASSAQCRSI